MNNPINDKKLILIILAILFIATSFLFIKGEISLKKASQGYNIVAFQNTKQKLHPSNWGFTLHFYIQNFNKNSQTYKIIYLIDNQPVVEIAEKLKSGQEKIIDPPKEVTNKINDLDSESFEYKIQVTNNNETKTIHKQINK